MPPEPVEEPDESEEEDEDEYEYYTGDEEERTSARVSNVAELRELLEECRKMSAEAEQHQPLFFPF